MGGGGGGGGGGEGGRGGGGREEGRELALEQPPPFHAYRQHEHHHSGLVYSKLLDPRWAEVALGHLREQADFVEKRAKLSNKFQTQAKSEDGRAEEGTGTIPVQKAAGAIAPKPRELHDRSAS